MLDVPIGTVMSRISRGRRSAVRSVAPRAVRPGAVSGKRTERMATCTSIDPLVTPYVDGELPLADRTLVDEHLRRCPPCQARSPGRRPRGTSCAHAEPGLDRRARVRAPARQVRGARARDVDEWRRGLGIAPGQARPSRPGGAARPGAARLAPFALAASLVLLVGGTFLYQGDRAAPRASWRRSWPPITSSVSRSTTCSARTTRRRPSKASMLSSFGWHLHVPGSSTAPDSIWSAPADACTATEGRRSSCTATTARPVSIFMLPENQAVRCLVEVLGHQAAIWSAGDRTFVLVTRGSRAEVERMATYRQNRVALS